MVVLSHAYSFSKNLQIIIAVDKCRWAYRYCDSGYINIGMYLVIILSINK